MQIRAVRAEGPPPFSAEQTTLWLGGYNEIPDDQAGLTSSIISLVSPDLNVGEWYSISKLEVIINDADWSSSSIWTAVQIADLDLHGQSTSACYIKQGDAARVIIKSTIGFLSLLGPHNIWVRFE